ncbi:MAG: hypothetical protein H6821_10715 [Planctomycetaceae bacterium]|nr:hypothetical protein [Planctomycetales bacterium]MCB9874638.1 hypothetical protein [Planctomycetaceae bacterium]MCB9936938.1 hypothetical protein [Planctomycetaceae bacterium]HRX77712.1 hypothetical protein [Pirellulaceae bacterium]
MKLRFLASLSVLAVLGCSQSPAPSTVSDASPDVEISIPDMPSESSGETADTEAAANETLVSLSVPDMH